MTLRRRLTDDEVAAIKRGTHPVSKEAMDWAASQMPLVEAERATSLEEMKSFDEFRAEVFRRFPHLAT